MKPLNQPERRTRLWQFALLYLLALLVPLVASYYLFSNSSLAAENARLKQTLVRTNEEQTRLVTRFDTLTKFLHRMHTIDQRIAVEPESSVRSFLVLQYAAQNEGLGARLSELRNDTAQLQIAAHRRLGGSMLTDFELIRNNHSIIDGLREKAVAAGEGNRGLERMASELASCKQEVSSEKQQVVTLQAALAACSRGGGGGGNPPPPPPPPGNRLQLELLRDQLAFAEADCIRQRAVERKPRSKERRQLLESSREAFIKILQDPATDALRQSIEQTIAPINVELGREPRFLGIIPAGG